MTKGNGMVEYKENGKEAVAQEEKPYHLLTRYDYRFNTVGFHVAREGEDDGPRFLVPLGELIKQLGIGAHEIMAAMEPQYRPTEGVTDIDPARIRMLEETDWKGKTVLDIGGYDGFAAEIAHKGGAARAICLDNHQYEHYGWADKRKDGVEYVQDNVMRYTVDSTAELLDEEPRLQRWVYSAVPGAGYVEYLPQPDVLINYNVLYHVKNPWAFLDKCREIIKEDGEMLLCTLFRYSDQPTWHLYEPLECNPSDRTVFWGPSLLGMERMLKFTGWTFERYALAFDRTLYRCFPIPGFEPDLAKEGYAKS